MAVAELEISRIYHSYTIDMPARPLIYHSYTIDIPFPIFKDQIEDGAFFKALEISETLILGYNLQGADWTLDISCWYTIHIPLIYH